MWACNCSGTGCVAVERDSVGQRDVRVTPCLFYYPFCFPLAVAASTTRGSSGAADADKDGGLKQTLIATVLSNLQLSIRKVCDRQISRCHMGWSSVWGGGRGRAL
jgi:hypothetical protein